MKNDWSSATTLNTGGTAEVSLCVLRSDHNVQRLCVAKQLLPHLSRDPKYQELLIREARLLQYLQHQNIVQIYGIRRLQDSLIILMEYVHGVDLRHLLEECKQQDVPLRIPICVMVGSEVAAGLHQAYETPNPASGGRLGIVHRDISPGNILISSRGEIKLTDFGIAENIRLESPLLRNRLSGKLPYMSPEQRLGRPCTPASDIFSLGCTLWEMIAGKRFFMPQDFREMPPDCHTGSLLAEDPSVEPELDEIVTRCLRHDPGARFASARELHQRLMAFQNQHFPTYSAEDLATFVGTVCADRLTSTREVVRRILTDGTSAVVDMSSAEFGTGPSLGDETLVENEKPVELEFDGTTLGVDVQRAPTQPRPAQPVPNAKPAPQPAAAPGATAVKSKPMSRAGMRLIAVGMLLCISVWLLLRLMGLMHK